MTTSTDDDATFASRLRAEANRAAPSMSLDVTATMAAGRRRVHRRRATAAAVLVATLAAIAVGGVLLRPVATPVVPATPVQQQPHPIGTKQTVQLAPGLQATNLLTDANASLNQNTWQSTGLSVVDDQGRTLQGALIVDTPRAPDPNWVGPAPDTAIGIELYGADSPAVPTTLSWYSQDRPSDHDPDAAGTTAGNFLGLGSGDASIALIVGEVPRWLPDPRVALVLPNGIRAADGSTLTWVELPTFRSPTADGRLLYAFVADGRAGVELNGVPHSTLVVGSDGSTYTDQCPQGLSRCSHLQDRELITIAAELSGTATTAPAADASPRG
jgi:hypothetical protein